MFIVSISYQCPLSDIEPHLEEHIAFLNRYYVNGTFLASGRKNPRTGGIILAIADNQQKLESILKEDPFKREQLAHYEITEFIPSKTAPGLEHLLEA